MESSSHSEQLRHFPATRKTGNESFKLLNETTTINLLDFWQWSASDLVSNATRGRLAEFIIASALGLATGVRNEWDAFDLLTSTGLRIEVKSCAYLQAWKQNKLSRITFSTRKTRSWDASTGIMQNESIRQSDLYIFALLAHRESKKTLNPLDLDQWHFYPIPTRQLNDRTRSQHSISLKSLQALCPSPTQFKSLASVVKRMETDIISSSNRLA